LDVPGQVMLLSAGEKYVPLQAFASLGRAVVIVV
jgi:hypothetical protein